MLHQLNYHCVLSGGKWPPSPVARINYIARQPEKRSTLALFVGNYNVVSHGDRARDANLNYSRGAANIRIAKSIQFTVFFLRSCRTLLPGPARDTTPATS
jgi:hypothetical protein